MVYNSDDIKHLSVMAELETKEQPAITEVASVEHIPSSFDEKFFTLCESLRQHGFDNYAEKLENKIALVKQADVHLYRAHDEDGEDLIDAAHPDGDAHMADAQNDNGDIETILSQHKKIVDVITKMPTGKLASYVEQCKNALGIKKKAQASDVRPFLNSAIQVLSVAMDNFISQSNAGAAAKNKINSSVNSIKDSLREASAQNIMDAIEDIRLLKGFILTSNKNIAQRYGKAVLDAFVDWSHIGFGNALARMQGFMWGGMDVDPDTVQESLDQLDKTSGMLATAQKKLAEKGSSALQQSESQPGMVIKTEEFMQYIGQEKNNLEKILMQIKTKSASNKDLALLVPPVQSFIKELDQLNVAITKYNEKKHFINPNDISEIMLMVPGFSSIKTMPQFKEKISQYNEKLQQRLTAGV